MHKVSVGRLAQASAPAGSDSGPVRPTRVGPYGICCKLGEGGFGTVYLAFDRVAGPPIAMKIRLPKRIGSPEAEARFFREAQNVERLDHSGIVCVYDAGKADEYHYI